MEMEIDYTTTQGRRRLPYIIMEDSQTSGGFLTWYTSLRLLNNLLSFDGPESGYSVCSCFASERLGAAGVKLVTKQSS